MEEAKITIKGRVVRRIKIIRNQIHDIQKRMLLKKAGIKRQRDIHLVIERIKSKYQNGERIKLAFIGYQEAAACDVFTSLYRQFEKDDRFDITVIIAPYTHDSHDEMLRIQNNSAKYLDKLNIPYVKGYSEIDNCYVDMSEMFDIVFFEVEYFWMRKEFKAESFMNALTFLTPYGEFLGDNVANAHFNSDMIYDLYKVIPTGRKVYDLMCKSSYIGNKNIAPFLGNPKLDRFFDKEYKAVDVWKKQDKKKKRIIWAPHHLWTNYTNFLKYKDFMIGIAKKYDDLLQITFKPHPALASSLVEVAGWNQKEVDDYYSLWAEMPNTQYEGQEWVDLFLTSDAMILDSVGFMAEYSLSGHPACVLIREDSRNKREKRFSICGEEIYKRLYHAKNDEEICKFIDDIVIKGNDVMGKERDEYIFEEYYPQITGSAAYNIYKYIIDIIGMGECRV